MGFRIYLDYQATTPLDGDVLASISTALKDAWGNPSSNHTAGKYIYMCGARMFRTSESQRGQVAAKIRGEPWPYQTILLMTDGQGHRQYADCITTEANPALK